MADRSIRFLALGDSYTAGTGVPAEESWPRQTARSLRSRGFPIRTPRIIAHHGWTSADLLRALEAQDLASNWDLVSLLIGVNDHYQGDPPALYRSHFSELLEWSISLAPDGPDRVVILSIPDWSVTPFAADRDRDQLRAALEKFNRINRELTHQAGAHYLDITPLSRRASLKPGGLVDDGLHPSGPQYRIWTDEITAALQKQLADHPVR
jgi:lysophospholipase L1-like esterase